MSERAHRIMVVDDHPLMRDVLRDFLGAVPDLEVCAEASSGEEALLLLEELTLDLVLVDTSLGEMSGIDFVVEARRRAPNVPCLMLSGHGQQGYVERALTAGARGYVLKGDPAELPRAISKVLDGEVYLSPRLEGPEHGAGDGDRGGTPLS